MLFLYRPFNRHSLHIADVSTKKVGKFERKKIKRKIKKFVMINESFKRRKVVPSILNVK